MGIYQSQSKINVSCDGNAHMLEDQGDAYVALVSWESGDPFSKSTLKAIHCGESRIWTSLHARLSSQLRVLADRRLDHEIRMRVSPSDVVQETFLLAHRSASSFRGTNLLEVMAWIHTIFHNSLLKMIRDQKYTSKRSLKRESRWHNQDATKLVDNCCETPSHVIVRSEERELLDRAFQALSVPDRELITDHFIKGLGFAEISRNSGRTEVAVRKHWSRAILRWRKLVASLAGDMRGHSTSG